MFFFYRTYDPVGRKFTCSASPRCKSVTGKLVETTVDGTDACDTGVPSASAVPSPRFNSRTTSSRPIRCNAVRNAVAKIF